MAAFDVNMPDFLDKLVLSDDEMLDIVNSATGIAQDSIRSSLANHSATGSLVASVKPAKAKKSKYGDYIAVVGPKGKDSKGVRNIEKAVYLNYGTVNQPARPWLAQAINNAQNKVTEQLSEQFNERLRKKL